MDPSCFFLKGKKHHGSMAGGGATFSTAATAKGVAFFDLDLDEGDIGGAL